MINFDIIRKKLNNYLNFEPVGSDIFKLILPYYHEDGDMLDIFIREYEGSLLLFDNGLSLMRLSYTFDFTESRIKILNDILYSNDVNNKNGNLSIKADYDDFFERLNTFAFTIAKITNLDFLNKEVVSNLFYEFVKEYVSEKIQPTWNVEYNFMPYGKEITIPYRIISRQKNSKDIFLFPIKDNLSAARTTVDVCNLLLKNHSFTGVTVCEDFDALSKRDRHGLMNKVDKNYPNLEGYKQNFVEFLYKTA